MKKKNHTTTDKKTKGEKNQIENIINPLEGEIDSTQDSKLTKDEQITASNERIESLIKELEKSQKEKEENYFLYLQVVREKKEMYQFMKDSEEKLRSSSEKQIKKSMQDIIFVIKQIDYVIKNTAIDNPAVTEIHNLQLNTVKRLTDSYGVSIYKPEVGDKFDATKEKALSVERTMDPEKDETIANVLANAFIKDGQVISEALVTVFQFEKV